MSSILRFLAKMIPWMLLALPAYALLRAAYLRIKGRRANPWREAALLLLVLLLAALASQTVLPLLGLGRDGRTITQNPSHETNLIPLRVFATTWQEITAWRTEALLINLLGNIVLFMPIGFCLPLLWQFSAGRTVLTGLGCSLFIELCQLFLPRATDVDDLLLNTAGVLLGYGLYRLAKKHRPGFCGRFAPAGSPPDR